MLPRCGFNRLGEKIVSQLDCFLTSKTLGLGEVYLKFSICSLATSY
jgi:hypothetical protein